MKMSKIFTLYLWLFGLGVVMATSLRFEVPNVWYWLGTVAIAYPFFVWFVLSKTKSDIEEVTFRADALRSLGHNPDNLIGFYKVRRNGMLLSNLAGIFVGFGYALFAYFIQILPNVSFAVTAVYIVCAIPFVFGQLKDTNEEVESWAKVITT